MIKRFLIILILIINLPNLSIADDIGDFQIEGMSVGDSLLDYFTEEEIQKKLKTAYSYKDKFKLFSIESSKYEIYESVQFVVKRGDRKFEIYNIVGVFGYHNNINDCYKKKDTIGKELSDMFKDAKQNDEATKHDADKSGESKATTLWINLDSGAAVAVACYDWSEKMTNQNNWRDNLKVAILSAEFKKFLDNEAYK